MNFYVVRISILIRLDLSLDFSISILIIFYALISHKPKTCSRVKVSKSISFTSFFCSVYSFIFSIFFFLHEILKFCIANGNIRSSHTQPMNTQSTKWWKSFPSCTSDKGLMSSIYKDQKLNTTEIKLTIFNRTI